MADGNPTIFTVLRYRDADAAVAFLRDAFGFEEHEVHRSEEGRIEHAEMRYGSSMVMFGQHADDPWMGGKPPDALASTVSAYLVVDDVDGAHDRAVAAGATVVRPLEDMDYGAREFSVRDPEGNLWSFGNYDPNRPPT